MAEKRRAVRTRALKGARVVLANNTSTFHCVVRNISETGAGLELPTTLAPAHNAAMECYRRAMLSEQPFEGRRENLTQANKLSRTYTLLLEALNRHRGKGQQKVTVEHVHAHEGGQAIVGNVEPNREGGGGEK